ncbi:MAG TPA: DUF2946 family protein [Herbaspirillum sp.]|jgi:hypothetical protein
MQNFRQRFNRHYFTLCVMLLALSLRSLVPAGYMPDAGALRDGRLEMAFCTSDGMKSIVVGAHHEGAPASGDAPHHSSQSNDCPFSVLSALPAMPSMALALVGMPLLLSPAQAAPRPAPLPAVLSQGPPLGSRAPPHHLI